jgi:hypothetical protein
MSFISLTHERKKERKIVTTDNLVLSYRKKKFVRRA